LGRASQIALVGLADGSIERLAALRDRLESALTTLIPETRINGKGAPRVPNTSNILFEHVGGDTLVLALDELGIASSRGSACSAGAVDPSSVLMAMGLNGEQSRSRLRFSLGKQNTADEIERAIAVIPGSVKALREEGPFSGTRDDPWYIGCLSATSILLRHL
jgi:cysteine desulfurase